jgi:hypothetical protein
LRARLGAHATYILGTCHLLSAALHERQRQGLDVLGIDLVADL